MAFSFARAFLESFLPSQKEGPSLTELIAQLPEPYAGTLSARQEGIETVTPEDAWLLSDEEKAEDGLREAPLVPEAFEVTSEEAFLEAGQWLFATRSHHVNAMRYMREEETLVVVYDRGDTWAYDPIDLSLARKFALDLIDGSPGTDVWDYLRLRGTQHEHREGINAVMISPPGPEADRRPRRESYNL